MKWTILLLLILLTAPFEAQSNREDMLNYFPMAQGTEWKYEIKLGESEPLNYRTISWPLVNNQSVTYAHKGLIINPTANINADTLFLLEMKVVKPQENKVEVIIERDDLGIFEGAKHVSWAISNLGSFSILELIDFSREIPGAPSPDLISNFGWDLSESWLEGRSIRVIFFIAEPGSRLVSGGTDSLTFMGTDTNVPKNEGKPLLHFRRVIEQDENEEGIISDYVSKGFIEDMWYSEGIGLVRLEQKVDGITSMTWTLV